MERKKFIKTCCYTIIGIPFISLIESCGSLHYATATSNEEALIISKTEFTINKKGKKVNRSFVLINSTVSSFPICVYKLKEDQYLASLLKCTHQGCELNVGGGMYTCPCHGSQFSTTGKVLEGPADQDLRTFTTKTNDEYIYISLT